MRRVEPAVFLIGESVLHQETMVEYLESIKASSWWDKNAGMASDADLLTEIMGRLCYKSWEPGLNKNVTKIREGNQQYVGNLIKQRHGSVLEHGSTNWIFSNVSRVFTHELVRHRVGVAFSQESLRYVRSDDLGIWLPQDPELTPEMIAMCEGQVKSAERFAAFFAHKLQLDAPGADFERKKKWTSFIRRFLPQGMATEIGVTINFRELRHVLEMRTSLGAEVEIRLVFDKVAQICKEKWPSIMADFHRNDAGEWKPAASKV